MKNYLPLVISLFFSFSALASQIVIEDPCGGPHWLDNSDPVAIGSNVGSASVSALNRARIPFVGDERGISSIRNTVTGNDAMEVISDVEMRAYGWCFSLNGIEPNEMPNEIFVTSENDIIRWYFGFAHFRDGDWISYCTPTSLIQPAYICED